MEWVSVEERLPPAWEYVWVRRNSVMGTVRVKRFLHPLPDNGWEWAHVVGYASFYEPRWTYSEWVEIC